ncbi:DegT/DnrJ/EryC1/StrS family aminotransferase [Pseudomonas helleri]|uniref:DegT/DnrJ/EryC1/StrS family aminotransferase n=1 Tax=Pseudomonas helleri TaxID=1608996 RepID=UPI00396A45A8
MPPHKQQAYSELNGLSFPVAEKIHREVISIPLDWTMDDDQIETVIEACNSFVTPRVDK